MMAARRPLMAANWKMHKTIAETESFIRSFLPRVEGLDGVEVVLCPPFPALARAAELVRDSGVVICAQNMHEEQSGAFTGEVSAPMLIEVGARATLLGHSERRRHFGEGDDALAAKLPAALEAGLTPVLCVGETEDERDAEETQRVLRTQVGRGLERVDTALLPGVVIAYEPVWAIGTGRTATPEQAQEAIGFVRALVADRDSSAAERVRILYGGSVKPENAAELQARPDIDGALVGGASLDPEDFAAIVEAAG